MVVKPRQLPPCAAAGDPGPTYTARACWKSVTGHVLLQQYVQKQREKKAAPDCQPIKPQINICPSFLHPPVRNPSQTL